MWMCVCVCLAKIEPNEKKEAIEEDVEKNPVEKNTHAGD